MQIQREKEREKKSKKKTKKKTKKGGEKEFVERNEKKENEEERK